MDRRILLPDAGVARSACFCDAASGDYHARSGFSTQMGSPQANRALDDPNLALRFNYWRARVLDALQVVSTRGVTSNLALDR